jgi:hypothetical protein
MADQDGQPIMQVREDHILLPCPVWCASSSVGALLAVVELHHYGMLTLSF